MNDPFPALYAALPLIGLLWGCIILTAWHIEDLVDIPRLRTPRFIITVIGGSVLATLILIGALAYLIDRAIWGG